MSRKVLQVLSHSAGGIAKHVATIQRELDGRDGIVIDVAGPSDLPVAMPRAPIPIDIPRGPLGHSWAQRRLQRVVDGYDVVHSHGLRAGMDAGRAAEGTGVLRVVTVHNLVREDIAGPVRARLYRRAEKLAISANDRVLAVSADIAGHLERASPSPQIELLHLGIEAPRVSDRSRSEIRTGLGVADDEVVIVSVARLDRQKALHVLIDAVARLDGVAAVVVGTGPLHDELVARAESKGISRRFHLVGWRDDVADAIRAADVFCLSSVWEGVPLAAQEAIALGVPVVATDVGGMRELIQDGVSGSLVPPGRPDALATAIRKVLDDPSAAHRYAAAAAARLEQEFSTSRMLDRLQAIYSAGTGG